MFLLQFGVVTKRLDVFGGRNEFHSIGDHLQKDSEIVAKVFQALQMEAPWGWIGKVLRLQAGDKLVAGSFGLKGSEEANVGDVLVVGFGLEEVIYTYYIESQE